MRKIAAYYNDNGNILTTDDKGVVISGGEGMVQYHPPGSQERGSPGEWKFQNRTVFPVQYGKTYERVPGGSTRMTATPEGTVGQPPAAKFTIDVTDPAKMKAGYSPFFVLQTIQGFLNGIAVKWERITSDTTMTPEQKKKELADLRALEHNFKAMKSKMAGEMGKVNRLDPKSKDFEEATDKWMNQPMDVSQFETKGRSAEEEELAALEQELAGDYDSEDSPYDKKKAPKGSDGTYVDAQGNRYPKEAVKQDQSGTYVTDRTGRKTPVSMQGESVATGYDAQQTTSKQIIGKMINLRLPEWSVLMDVPNPPGTSYLDYDDFMSYASTTPVSQLAMALFGSADHADSEKSFLSSLGFTKMRQDPDSGTWMVKSVGENWKAAAQAVPNYRSELNRYQAQYTLNMLNRFLGMFVRSAGSVVNNWFAEYRKNLDDARQSAVWKDTDTWLKSWLRVVGRVQARVADALGGNVR